MKPARFKEEQIVAVLKEHEGWPKNRLASMGTPKRRSTIGRPNSAALTFRGEAVRAFGRGEREEEASAEQMLGAAALRELLQKIVRRRQARCGRASAGFMSL